MTRQATPLAAAVPAAVPAPGRSRERFGDYLRRQRMSAETSLERISLVTRIPERSLRCLEEGEFDALPGDIFVRGFLRAYASCVGLDVDEVLRRYGTCGVAPAPVASSSARVPAPVAADDDRQGVVGRPAPVRPIDAGPPHVPGVGASVAASSASSFTPPARRMARGTRADSTPRRRARRSARARAARTAGARTLVACVPPILAPSAAAHRARLTIAVIVLVLVASIAMFLLLRRPVESPTRSSQASAHAVR